MTAEAIVAGAEALAGDIVARAERGEAIIMFS